MTLIHALNCYLLVRGFEQRGHVIGTWQKSKKENLVQMGSKIMLNVKLDSETFTSLSIILNILNKE